MDASALFRPFTVALTLVAALTGSTAGAQDVAVVSPLFEEITAVPGQTYERVLDLENRSGAPQSVRVVQLDYLSGVDGNAYYPVPEDRSNARSNAAWIALPRTSIVVPPDTAVSVPYSVTVPPDLPQIGTYWSVLMVEPEDTGPPIVADAGQVEVRIHNRYRYAVHVASTIGEGPPAVSFETPRLAEDARALLIDLRNEGVTMAYPDAWLEVYGPDGESLGRFDARAQPLYPGSIATTAVDLNGLPGGGYAALLYVDAGGGELVGARLNLNVPDALPQTAVEAGSEGERDAPNL